MFWELIRSNRRKSIFLLFGMALCLEGIGYAIGVAIDPEYGGLYGILGALALFLFMLAVSYFGGDSIMLSSSGAAPVSRDIHPQLFNIVEEMQIASGLGVTPQIYIIPDPGYNAFATGLRTEKSAIAVTAGMLGVLNRDELQGVVAHEMSHIQNRDVMYMTFAGVMLGSIQMMTEGFFRGMARSSRSSSRTRSGSSSSSQAQLIFLILAVVLAIVGPLLAQIFYFSLSRKREYLADASAVRLTRYPEGLAAALEKISFKNNVASASKVTSALFIENPLHEGGMASLFDTHPPIQKRIQVLRQMSGADYVNYQKAFSDIVHQNLIPKSGLAEPVLPLRSASAQADSPATKIAMQALPSHEVMDLMRATNQFSFLVCKCGIKVKVPPEMKHPKLKCLRCGRWMEIPIALSAVVDQALEGKSIPKAAYQEAALVYERKTAGWETFRCSCGNKLQLSPLFSGTQMECLRCSRNIRVLLPENKT